ncbi:DUF4377 domain-containing protein [Rufibacter immobilis]|uniref:DUF4377 domain-containing protein n=1 Tax=Rufibacter immobilis TaxID=1348778 RepID=A0A3M9MQW2_9BACT|nr:DUF4377 domain-containing protein [Rufibacter immobilis]RNI27891.1 DUF4377 domain-containing protein [Rufibacter immobilis]
MRNFLSLLTFVTLLTACSDEEVDRYETTMRINSYRQDCQGVGEMKCLLTQEGDKIGSTEWNLFYDSIQGFQYEEGFVYTLKVRVEKIENPPADGSSRTYVLLEVLSKEKV